MKRHACSSPFLISPPLRAVPGPELRPPFGLPRPLRESPANPPPTKPANWAWRKVQRGPPLAEISWQGPRRRGLLATIPSPPGQGATLAQPAAARLAGLAPGALSRPAGAVGELQFAARPGEPVRPALDQLKCLMVAAASSFCSMASGGVIALARQVRSKQSRLRPDRAAGESLTSRPPCRGIYPAEPRGWTLGAAASIRLGAVQLQEGLQQTYQGSARPLALQTLAGDQPEQANGQLPHAGERLEDTKWQELCANGNRWLTDLEQERFRFCLRPSPCRVHGLTAAGERKAPAAGECTALAA